MSRGTALPFHDLRWGVVGQRHAPAALPAWKDPVPIVQETGWATGAGLDGCGKSRPPTEFRSPDRPARSESLYRLRYPGPRIYAYIYLYLYRLVIREVKNLNLFTH